MVLVMDRNVPRNGPLVVLHGTAMQTTVLTDDRTAVDANDIAVGEGLLDDAHGLCVKVGLGVGGNEHGTVDDQVVSVGSGQTVYE